MRIISDYSVYRGSVTEKVICSILGITVGSLVGYAFYEHILVIVIAALGGAVIVNLQYIKYRKKSIRKRLLLQFKDMCESLLASVSAGSNIQDSFLYAKKDMEALHGPNSFIVLELQHINESLHSNQNLEQLLTNFGKRSSIKEIKSFAYVFETSNRLGGNFLDIVSMTCQIICDKIEIEQEISTVVSAKKSEQSMMLVMPVFFLLLLKGLGASIADMTSATGIISSTVALILFVLSYVISSRLLKIEL